jgi:hypothetical protein
LELGLGKGKLHYVFDTVEEETNVLVKTDFDWQIVRLVPLSIDVNLKLTVVMEIKLSGFDGEHVLFLLGGNGAVERAGDSANSSLSKFNANAEAGARGELLEGLARVVEVGMGALLVILESGCGDVEFNERERLGVERHREVPIGAYGVHVLQGLWVGQERASEANKHKECD